MDISMQPPSNYQDMIAIAKKLSESFRFVRIDLYNIDGKIYDIMSFSHSSLREQALMIKDEDFKNYFDALVQFWTDIPERMYTAYDI